MSRAAISRRLAALERATGVRSPHTRRRRLTGPERALAAEREALLATIDDLPDAEFRAAWHRLQRIDATMPPEPDAGDSLPDVAGLTGDQARALFEAELARPPKTLRERVDERAWRMMTPHELRGEAERTLHRSQQAVGVWG